jgi:hypothetical protein
VYQSMDANKRSKVATDGNEETGFKPLVSNLQPSTLQEAVF